MPIARRNPRWRALQLGHATSRTARAWAHKQPLREILEREKINVVCDMLKHWCNCAMRSKVEPIKEVAALVRCHIEGLVA